MMRASVAANVVEYNPFTLIQRKRNISISPGAKWDNSLSNNNEWVIPAGTPMAPVTAGTGLYKAIRRGAVVTAATAAEALLNLSVANGKKFAVGDVVNVLQNNATASLVTVSTVGTISTIDYTTGVITLTNDLGVVVSVGCFVEVAENGAATNPNSAVFLAGNVQTRNTDMGTNVTAEGVGIIQGQVEVVKLTGLNIWDVLIPRQIAEVDYIPATPGL